MSFRDALKKYRDAQGYQSPPSNTSGEEEQKTNAKPTASTGTSFRDKLKRYREEAPAKSLDAWVQSSYALLTDIQENATKWHDESVYKSRYDQSQNLLGLADSWRKQYSGNEEAISYINSVVEALSHAQSVAFSSHQFFSKFKDEEDYNFWDTHSTPEKRQAWYNEQHEKVNDLSEVYDNYYTIDLLYQDYQANPGAYTPEEAQDILAKYEKHNAYKKKYGSDKEIKAEIEATEAEIRNYEYGNYNENGRFYGSKDVDDNYAVTQRPDFEITSANRDYKNPTREEIEIADVMNDNSTWKWDDANGVYRDAFGNELAVDENNTYYNPVAQKTQVTDKLGLYLSTPEDDRIDAALGDGMREGIWTSIMREGFGGSWQYLEDDELGIYYTYLGESQEKAYQYLEDMKPELNRRQTLDERGQWRKGYDEANLLGKIAMNAFSVTEKFVSNIAGTVDNTVNTLQGNDINPYSYAHRGMHYSQTVRGATAEELDKWSGGWTVPVLDEFGVDFTLGDIYQTGMSRLDSALATNVFGGGGVMFLGLGAAQDEAYRLYKQGASAEQITMGAFAAGAAEAVWEYISFGKLKEIDNVGGLKSWVKSVLIQGWNEAGEEALTEATNIVTNALVMGSRSDLAELYKENEESAFRTFLDLTQQAAHSAFGGFLGGIGAGGVKATGSYFNTRSQYEDAGMQIVGSGKVGTLRGLATKIGKTDPKIANLASQISDKATPKNARQVGRLYSLTADAVTEANVQDMTDALIQKGMSKTAAKKIAGAVVDAYMHNSQVSQEHAELLEALAKDTRVTETVNALLKSHEGSVWQRTNQLMNLGSYQEGAVAEATEEGGQVVSNDTGVETVTQSTVAAAEAGTFLRSSGESVRNVRIESVENGKVTVNADGRQAALEDVSFGSEAQAVMVSQVTGFAGMTAAGANTILQVAKRTDAPSGVFTEEALALYEAGMMGNESILKAAGKANIPAQMRSWIYQEGRNAAQTGTDAAQQRLDQTYREAKQALEQTDEGKKSYGVTLADGITEKSMDDVQSDSYELAKTVSAAVQVETVVYDGGTEWGFYDPNTDKIHLNINAKWSYTSMMTYTLAHELVHRAKAGSPQRFQAFADFLIKQYCKQGTSLESLINEQINAAKRMGKKMSRTQAFEEVVCDACQRLLLDTNAGQRLAEFAAQSEENRGFVKRFKQWLSKLMERLRSYYRNVEPESDAAKEFGKFDQKVKQMLADKFVDMSMDAGEKLSTIKAAGMTQKITTGEGSDVRFSINKNFYHQLNNWDGKTVGFSFTLGDTSEALQKAGIPKKKIKWDATKICALLAKHNGMTIDTVQKVPELLEHPVIIIDSKQSNNSKIVMGELYDEHGKVVTVVLLLTPTSKKGNVLDVIKVSSAEGRSHIQSLFTYEDGTPVTVRYVDKKRIQSWLNVNRLQLPLHNLDLDSTTSIRNPDENVNTNFATDSDSNPDIRYKAPVGEKTFKNGQNARGEFTANMLFDLGDLKGEWWTGRYNYGILGISKTDDTEFRQFYSEVYNRTKDMDEYEDAKQQASTETFIIHDGNGREYIYSVELDGYMHGTVLSKIDKQKYEAVIRKETKGGKYGKSTADIKRRTRSARIDLGRNNPGDGGDHTSNGNPGYGGLGGRSSGGVKMGNAAGERTPDQALSDLNSAKRNKLPVSEDQVSSNPYSYANLVNKPDMKITEFGGMVPTDRAEIISQAKKNAAKVGRVDPKTGSISVHVDDIDTDVVLGRDGLKHSIDRRLGVNAPVVLKAGEIISNSIRINEVIPKKIDASGAYVLIGTAVNKSGELYIVRSVVNSFSNEVTSIDVLYAINAKKEPAALLPLFTDESALGTDSTISIANLLDYVNAYFPDVLPEDVLRHYGYDSRPEGDLGSDALYKIPVAEDTLSEGYDTSNLDWAIEADILSEADQARFWEAIAEISKRKYNSFARTKNGGYIIENGTKMMFTDGDFKAPTLSKIIDFCYDDGHDIEEARRMIRNEAERTGRTSESLSLIERVYGSWFVAEYDIRDYPTYGRENRQGKGTNSERASSESASWGVRFEGTDSVREGQGLKKKLPVAEDLSPRALLANAAESVAQNEMERNRLLEYQQKSAQIDTQERKLRELRAQIKELSFAKGPRDQAKLKELQLEAQKTVNRINIMDKQLMRIEAFKPLQNLLAREKAAARKRAEQKSKAAAEKLRTEYRQKMEDQRKELSAKYQESRAKAVEGRKKTDLRHKIKRFKDKMQKVLDHPTDNQFVPASLFTAMVEVCELIDTDTELYKADGSLNLSQQRRNETRDRLRKLAKEYEKLGDHTDPVYAGEFDKQVYDYLNMLEESYAGKTLEEMSYGELEDLYSILRSIEETVQDARRLIAFGDKADVYEVGNAIIQEQKAVTKSRKGGERSIAQKLRDKNFNATLSPMRNVARMSGYAEGSLLTKLFRELELGNRKKKRFVMESYKSFEGLTEGTEYENACSKIFGGKQYEDSEGRKFGVSKMQMMQAILSWERELANQDLSHVSKGGFVFADVDLIMKGKIAQAISNKNAHRVHDAVEMVEQFREALKDDRWCQAYLTAARIFFNETAKNAINETGMALKHRLLATGQSYIPYEVDRNSIHREITATDSIQQTISGYGMLKSLQKKAPQPLVITGLNNIIDRHIDQVGNLYGLAVPIRNFNKVWNMKEPGTADPMVKGAVERNWGVEGVKHIEQTVMDLQGPRNRTQSEFYRKVKSGYITATFLLNLSVVFKQDGSLFAANSELLRIRNPVSMMGNLLWTIANYRKISQEVDKYTATAWERRQGVTDSELHTLMTQAKKSKLSRWLHSAPVVRSAVFHPTKWIAAMDSAVALSLWRYAKADTAKRTGLKGEALMAATAEFYDDVVEHTQSMTDVLHRPEIQKSGNFLSEAFGTFKTDLYQMAGQLEEKRGKYAANKTKENAGALGRTVYATLTSALWTQLMTLVFAMIRYKPDRYRDEEDKEITFASVMERMAFDMAGDLLAYVFPLLGSEAVGLLEDVRYKESSVFADNLAQTAINDMVDAITTVAGSFRDGELPSQTEMRKLSTKVLQLFGVPANNILRIMDAIRLHATDIANGEFLSFNAGANRNASHHIHRVIERVEDGEMTVAKGLFEDAVDDLAGGDPEKDARDEAVSKLKTALGKKYKAGDVSAETAKEILSQAFGLSDDDIYWVLDRWDHAADEDYSKYQDFYTAVETGKDLRQVIKRYTDNGVEMEDLRGQIGQHFKRPYMAMSSGERASIKGYLLNAYELCGISREDAMTKIATWEYEAQYPRYVGTVSYGMYTKWKEYGSQAGVSMDMLSKVAAYKKQDGGRDQDAVRAFIDRLSATKAQKHGLWCCFYKASTSPYK